MAVAVSGQAPWNSAEVFTCAFTLSQGRARKPNGLKKDAAVVVRGFREQDTRMPLAYSRIRMPRAVTTRNLSSRSEYWLRICESQVILVAKD